MVLQAVTLDDKYAARAWPDFLTGTQAPGAAADDAAPAGPRGGG